MSPIKSAGREGSLRTSQRTTGGNMAPCSIASRTLLTSVPLSPARSVEASSCRWQSILSKLLEARRPLHLAGPARQLPPGLLVRTQFQGLANHVRDAFSFCRSALEHIRGNFNGDLTSLELARHAGQVYQHSLQALRPVPELRNLHRYWDLFAAGDHSWVEGGGPHDSARNRTDKIRPEASRHVADDRRDNVAGRPLEVSSYILETLPRAFMM